MRILITGLGGFIGSSISKYLTEKHDVYSFERSESPESGANKIIGNLLDTQSIYRALKDVKPDCIILMGAMSSLYQVEENPLTGYLTNTKSVEDFIRASNHMSPLNPPRIIFFSTDLVYDAYNFEYKKGFEESDSPKTKTRYGRSKLEAEHLLHFYPNGLALRISLTYGPPDHKNRGYLASLQKCIARNEPISLFNDEWRTPLNVNDIGLALGKIIDQKDSSVKLLHLSGNTRLSRVEFGQELLKTEAKNYTKLAISSRKDRGQAKKRGMDCSLNNRLAKEILGLEFKDSQ